MSSRITAFFRFPLVAACAGGLFAVAAMAGLGVIEQDDDGTTTVVEQTASRGPSSEAGLTARDIYERDAPGVVHVRSTGVGDDSAAVKRGLVPRNRSTATGSGFVSDDDGRIVTNFHVVDGASRVDVSFGDEKTVRAKVLGQDASTDLALLKVDPKGLDLRPLMLGDSSNVKVGDPTLAIGNPFGLDRTLTTGVVSALQRRIEAPNAFGIDNVIQTDAAINPGNSGGPLLDAAGRVIGVTSQIATSGSGAAGNVGIGFAVPVNTVREVIPQLREDGKVDRAYLGVTGRTIDSRLARYDLKESTGVLVQSVERRSPASGAGLRVGEQKTVVAGEPVTLDSDVIVAVGDKDIKTAEDLVTAISGRQPGETVQLTVSRDGKRREVQVKLAERPQQLRDG